MARPTQLCLFKTLALRVSTTIDYHRATIQCLKKIKCNTYKLVILILLCEIPRVHNYYDDKTVKYLSYLLLNVPWHNEMNYMKSIS